MDERMSSKPTTADARRASDEGPRLTPETFAEAFARNARPLWCIAAGVLGSPDAAEDVLQEGAIIALRKLDRFQPGTNFVAWMGRIVHYVALNHARRGRRQPVPMGERDAPAAAPAARAAAPSGRGELPVDQAVFDDEVMAALDALTPEARSCLLLRTLLDLPYRDIGRALDMPEGTAMSHVHRARRIMRARLEQREDVPT